MLLAFVVMSNMYSFSRGWYTYRTDSVSTNVCCFPVDISFGKADNRPSIRAFVISTNWRETMAGNQFRSLLYNLKGYSNSDVYWTYVMLWEV